MTEQLKKRADMAPEFTWQLNDIFPSFNEWEDAFQACDQESNVLSSMKDSFLETPVILVDFLNRYFDLQENLAKITGFAHMNWHQNTANGTTQEAAQRVDALYITITARLAFIEPAILAVDEATFKNWFDEEPSLQLYTHFINNLIRSKQHILSDEQEALMAMAADVAGSAETAFSMFNNADIHFPEVINDQHEPAQLSHGLYINYLKSADPEVRRTAFEAMHNTFAGMKNTLASIYSTAVKHHVFNMKARHFDSACQAALFTNNIDVNVYDHLIDSIHKHLPLLHRYVALRKKMLNVDNLHMYDIYTPMIKQANDKINFTDAKATVLEAIKPMGNDYVNQVKQAFEQRWLDVYENQGKRSGAYSWGIYGVHPYVLLNFQDSVTNMFTLAHEMGHAMHSFYSNKKQPYLYHDYSIFLAEIASTVNENLLIRHLLNVTEDKHQRRYLINHFLEGFRGTVFRQTMFAEYERMTHQVIEDGGALTADKLSEMYYQLNRKYYGESVIHDDLIRYEWARIPHFYYNFYVFQYATGFISAVAISDMILNQNKAADYRQKFLEAGSSAYPLDILKSVGVDMTSDEPIERAMAVFEELLNELEQD